ncbi:hypothetical protein BDV3_001140 [Batrachochytrium dendrobatidis]|uniref:C2 domain-containing protein n=1 Tax=Batrachochytrium dendrobatidis (strain JEL423) TaxID=403673 RepID=A0A177W8U5_BATDL|nr:hypothetical protein BDEG_20674 [Batrachochytrium dendrobatidis JEL423]
MPCILKVKIISARNLPIMDRTTDLTDAFVEVKFADSGTYRTQIRRRTLNPVWNEDFRFEVSDDADLQNEPLELKVMDYDQITYNDAIGTVFIDLNPLLTWDSPAQISGWFPVYDTLLGVRGELNAQVKLQLFGDINPFKDSSAGVQFFSVPTPPPNYQIVSVLGFVSALDDEDDPEYHWSDNFRTPRKSNEARTRVMFRLSGHIRRQLGKKVLELNGNAVLGFKQLFDLEEDNKTITARAVGTAVKLVFTSNGQCNNDLAASSASLKSVSFAGQPLPHDIAMFGSPTMPPTLNMASNAAIEHMDNMEADVQHNLPPPLIVPSHTPWRQLDQVPLTLEEFPRGAILGIGGLVSAASVKVLDKDERDVRSSWWNELRDEIKSHARSLRCPYIVGYTEQCSINEELAVLHCTGTAAWVDIALFNPTNLVSSFGVNLNSSSVWKPDSADLGRESLHPISSPSKSVTLTLGVESPTSYDEASHIPTNSLTGGALDVAQALNGIGPKDIPLPKRQASIPLGEAGTSVPHPSFHHNERSESTKFKVNSTPRRGSQMSTTKDGEDYHSNKHRAKKRLKHLACRSSHITYRRNESPFPMALTRCGICRRKYVPEILLTTIELPSELETIGKGVFIEALVCRQKKPRIGEARAVSISESIPFAQYDLHRQLMYKLRMYGLNAIFGLHIQISIGENLMTAVATGTAVYVRALPTPLALKVMRNLEVVDEEDERLMDLQRKIMIQSEANRKRIEEALETVRRRRDEEHPDQSDSDDDSASSKSESDDEIESPTTEIGGGPSNPGVLNMAAEPIGACGSNTTNFPGNKSQNQQSQQQRGVVVQIDDEQDEDLVLFLEQTFPDGFELLTIQKPPNFQSVMKNLHNFQMVTMVKQGTINAVSHHPNRQLAGIFRALHQELQYQVAYFSPCYVTGIKYNVQLPKEQGVQVTLQAMVIGGLPKCVEGVKAPGFTQSNSILNLFEQVLLSSRATAIDRRVSTLHRQMTSRSTSSNLDGASITSSIQDDMLFGLDEDLTTNGQRYQGSATALPPVEGMFSNSYGALGPSGGGLNSILGGAASRLGVVTGIVSGMVANITAGKGKQDGNALSVPTRTNSNPQNGPVSNQQSQQGLPAHPELMVTIPNYNASSMQSFLQKNVELSPNSWIPQAKVTRFLGRLSMHFVKEVNLVYDGMSGKFGMGGFTHMFLAELFAVVKAHTFALGGNGIIGFSMDQVLFSESLKNLGYAFVSVSGDVVVLEYLLPDEDAVASTEQSEPTLLLDEGSKIAAIDANDCPTLGLSTPGAPDASGLPVSIPDITTELISNRPPPNTVAAVSATSATLPANTSIPTTYTGRVVAFDDYVVVPQCDFATELFQRSCT